MIKTHQLPVLMMIPVILLAAACGPAAMPAAAEPTARPYTPVVVEEAAGEPAPLVGVVEDGLIAFQTNCSSCHAIEEGVVIEGPSLFAAGSRLEYDYIKESILYPEAHDAFVEAQLAAVDVDMPTDFAGLLTPQQLEDLIAYVQSLK